MRRMERINPQRRPRIWLKNPIIPASIRPSHCPENPDIPLSFYDQGVQGIDDPENGHNDRNEFEGVGDGESLVKDFENFIPQFTVGDHKKPIRL
jgi:hypothetical protein